MAEAANEDSVAAAASPPQYRKAVVDIRSRVKTKKDKVSSLNGEIADAWAKIEGLGCNKTGAKLFHKLDGLESEERADVIRTLQGMIAVSDWPELTDLVDQADGVPASYNLVGDGDDDDGDDDDGDAPAKDTATALARARNRLRSVDKSPDAMDGPAVH